MTKKRKTTWPEVIKNMKIGRPLLTRDGTVPENALERKWAAEDSGQGPGTGATGEERLRKFVDVMNRKFVGTGRSLTHDSFHQIETNGPDEAEVRVSDIKALLEGYDKAMAACRALILPPLNEDLQNAIDLARIALGLPVDKESPHR